MIFSRDNTSSIETEILQLLTTSPKNRKELVDFILSKTQVSFQAVYKSLKKLEKAGVIIIYKQTISLNGFWISKVTNFCQNVQKHILPKITERTESITILETIFWEKENISLF
jgi:DNA-binding Lrp family transcriptional regulator